jgi:hypothetical protein
MEERNHKTAEYNIYLNRLITRNTETKRRGFQAIDIRCVRKIKGKTKRHRVRNTILEK